MADYGTKYRLTYCDYYGISKRIDILRSGYIGDVTPFVGGISPSSVSYKNDEDERFSEVISSSAVIQIIAQNDSLSLSTFYTDDEKEWQIKIYDNDILRWSGFLTPDDANEPFKSFPYQFEITATDQLSALKDVAYSDGKVLIRKVASIKDILIECLNKTGLTLNSIISSNTYAVGMSYSNDADCPLEQTYIDTNRFIDSNGLAYSSLDVIKAISKQFNAQLVQEDGKWCFIDQTQKANRSTYLGREYNSSGLKLRALVLDGAKQANAENISNADHTIQNDPAYKKVINYYQYGYLSNKISNGDLNLLDASSNSGFKDWSVIGGLGVIVRRKSVSIPGSADLPIDDWYAEITNSYNRNSSAWFVSAPIPTKVTNRVGISATIGFPNPYSQSMDHGQATFKVVLSSAGLSNRWWDGFSWLDQDSIVQIDVNRDDAYTGNGSAGTTVNMSLAYPPYEGTIRLYFSGVQARPGFAPITTYIDSFSLSLDESNYYRSAIGNVIQLTQIGNYSKSQEPRVLLFGDDSNVNRTSFLRLKDGTHTTLWVDRYNLNSAPVKLQVLLANNLMAQYRRPSRRFEGTFLGQFSALDTISIQDVPGKFRVLSGVFDHKKNTAKFVLTEVIEGYFGSFETLPFEDTGDYANSSGNNIGTIGGVSVPPQSASFNLDGYETAAVAATKYQPIEDQRLSKANTVFFNELSGNKVKIPDTIGGKFWKIYIDSIGSGGGATAPPAGGGGATLYSQLLDVALSGLTAGQVAVWDGTKWTNRNMSADVDLSAYYTKQSADDRFLRLAPNSSSPQNANFAIGYDPGNGNFIQSHSGLPLNINPLGNDITFNGKGLGSFAFRTGINGNEVNTGPAVSAYDIGVSEMLRWKNYGNSHVIFDASQGTAPTGSAIDNRNPRFGWDSTYPTLMGWNGVDTYGVRVDVSRYAESAGIWNGYSHRLIEGQYASGLGGIMGVHVDNTVTQFSVTTVKNWLGLGDAAYTNQSNYMRNLSASYIGNSSGWYANDVYSIGGLMTFSYQDSGTPSSGSLISFAGGFGGGGYSTQILGSYINNNLFFRSRNGDNGTWHSWRTIWNNENLNPQVNSVANSVVQRDGNGYIVNTYYQSTRGEENLAAAQYLFDAGDGYMRKKNVYATAAEITGVGRHWSFRNDAPDVNYANGTLELINSVTRPTLGLHWAGVVASTISIEGSGRIAIMNNPGTSYENLVAKGIAAVEYLYTDGPMTALGAIVGGTLESKGQSHAAAGTNGGFTNVAFNQGHNNIWRLNNSPEYGIGYYQGLSGGDYVGFHFGDRNNPGIRVYSNTLIAPILRATSELHIPSTSGRQWKLYVKDN